LFTSCIASLDLASPRRQAPLSLPTSLPHFPSLFLPPKGIWNERSWGTVDYVVSLRNALDAAGLTSTKIVVPDGGGCSDVTAAAKANASFAQAVYALGEHYPCKRSCPATAEVGMKFWASEDYSTVADWAGGGCWGRSLNQNFVLLNSTSTIAWSTIWSVYPQDIYFGNGLMYGKSKQARSKRPPLALPFAHFSLDYLSPT
jgi:hypothetical protein